MIFSVVKLQGEILMSSLRDLTGMDDKYNKQVIAGWLLTVFVYGM